MNNYNVDILHVLGYVHCVYTSIYLLLSKITHFVCLFMCLVMIEAFEFTRVNVKALT